MLTYLAVVSTLALVISLVDLIVDLKVAKPVRRRAAVERAAEHGAAYAEQLARKRTMTAHEKFTHALHAARDELAVLGVTAKDSEVGRAIEVAVSGLRKG